MTDRQLLRATLRARRDLHAATGYRPDGGHYRAVDRYFDRVEAELRRRLKPPAAPWADVGPVQPGGKSLLDMVPTHPTSGIPLYAAFDTAWGGGGGVICIAPENVTVVKRDTSANPGEAMFLAGASGLEYWVGHLTRDWPIGTTFSKGATLAKTLPIPGNSDHAHWGVNVEAFLGKGKELWWGGAPDKPARKYALGSPTIREQLMLRGDL